MGIGYGGFFGHPFPSNQAKRTNIQDYEANRKFHVFTDKTSMGFSRHYFPVENRRTTIGFHFAVTKREMTTPFFTVIPTTLNCTCVNVPVPKCLL